MEQVLSQVIDAIEPLAPDPRRRSEIIPEALLGNDLGIDSLALINIILSLENKFNVAIKALNRLY